MAKPEQAVIAVLERGQSAQSRQAGEAMPGIFFGR
jgi:hypothetical protein